MNKWWLILLYIPSLLLFVPLNWQKARYYFKTKLDDILPLLSFFVVPYVFYYIFVAIAWVYLFKKSVFEEMILALVMTQYAADLFWRLVPNGVKKPKIKVNNVFDRIVYWYYRHIGECNGFPSGHVFMSLICGYYLYISGQVWAMPVAIIIAVSTVMVKQHYVVDILGGILWAVGGIWVAGMV